MQPPAWTRNSPGAAGCRAGPRLGGRTRQAAARDNVHPHRFGSAGSGPFALTGGVVVHPLQPQVLYAGPGKQPVAVLPAIELGGPTWVPVVQASPGWDRVLLPSRPNRATGWIFTGGTGRSRLDIRRSSYLIRIQIGARKLSVDDGGRSLGTWTVAVGAEGTPTAAGRTFLLASLAPPRPSYSPLILPLGRPRGEVHRPNRRSSPPVARFLAIDV